MKKTKKISNIACGLFNMRPFWRNFKDIPIFLKRFVFLLKHGYSPMAQWETFEWFICVMREIMRNYRDHRCGDFIFLDIPQDQWTNKTNEYYDKMISLLDKMSENYWNSTLDLSQEEIKKRDKEAAQAKDEFFKLFAEKFYDLWD